MEKSERAAVELLQKRGWGLESPVQFRCDMEEAFLDLWDKVSPYTMTSAERGYALYQSTLHIARSGLQGAFVECGVWKGGSALLMILALLSLGIRDRKLYLFDTFEGMPEPGDEDRIAWSGEQVKERWKRNDFASWAISQQEVMDLLCSTGYPPELIITVAGKVEESLPSFVEEMERPALLRLDTDWYASTRCELELLYPRLRSGGVLIIDDYGHFAGARQAVDEYFSALSRAPLLSRIDYTGRLAVKHP